jgi:hypothetical protein
VEQTERMADQTPHGWWRSVKWVFGIVWGVAAAFALTIAYPYGDAVFVPTLGVCAVPLVLFAFVGPAARAAGGGGATVFVLACIAGTAASGYFLHQGLFPEDPAAVGSASDDARFDMWVSVKDLSKDDSEYRNSIRLKDNDKFSVSVGIQNLSYEVPMRDAAVEFRVVKEQGGNVRLLALVTAPGFPDQRESATVQSSVASPASAMFEAGTPVTVIMKDGESTQSITLDTLDVLPKTWHLPLVPFDTTKDTAWITFVLVFDTDGSIPPSSPTPTPTP